MSRAISIAGVRPLGWFARASTPSAIAGRGRAQRNCVARVLRGWRHARARGTALDMGVRDDHASARAQGQATVCRRYLWSRGPWSRGGTRSRGPWTPCLLLVQPNSCLQVLAETPLVARSRSCLFAITATARPPVPWRHSVEGADKHTTTKHRLGERRVHPG
jgi:hypothetical protein